MKKAASPSRLSLYAWFLVLSLFAIGTRGIYWVYRDTKLACQSAHWRTTQGHIVSSEVRRSLGGAPGSAVQWAPRIRYRYSVGQRAYVGGTISFPARRGSRSEAQRKVNAYPVGSPVTVFYDPLNPEHSCLEQGHINYFFIIMVGFISRLLLSAGGALLYFIIKRMPNQKDA